jgi:N-sulfoglucosamine sulfohydrolase
LYVNYFDPHGDYKIPVIKGVPKKLIGPEDVEPFPWLAVEHAKIRMDLVGFYNATLRLDAGIGMLMDVLEKRGVADNTLVIFLGDNGPPFARGKMTCYEAGLQVPFIVRWPGKAKSGLVSDEFISTVDIMPTICEAAGADVPDAVVGKSFIPLLEGKNAPWRDELFCEFTSHDTFNYFPARTIRNRRYKLIHNIAAGKTEVNRGKGGGSTWDAYHDPKLPEKVRKAYELYYNPPEVELYDLQEDPCELINLAGKPDLADIQEELIAKLMQWRIETSDPLLDEGVLAEQITEHEQLRKENRLRDFKQVE